MGAPREKVPSRTLEASTPAQSWADVVVRAELTSHRRRNCFNTWAAIDEDDEGQLLPHRSFAEFMLAILKLGNVPPPAEAEEPLWVPSEKQKARMAEAKTLRKAWVALVTA